LYRSLAVTLFAEKEKTANSALGYAQCSLIIPAPALSLPLERKNEQELPALKENLICT